VFERLCGYVPQAFTHVGLINAAVSLTRRLEGAPPLEHQLSQTSDQDSEEARV
jgi:hypothetical protein